MLPANQHVGRPHTPLDASITHRRASNCPHAHPAGSRRLNSNSPPADSRRRGRTGSVSPAPRTRLGLAAGAGFGEPAHESRFTRPIGVVVVDHGSRKEESNAMLEVIVEMFRTKTGHEIVEPAHMEITGPTIQEAICELWSNVLARAFA